MKLDEGLPEKDFVQEGGKKNWGPFLFWFLVCIFVTLAVWFAISWSAREREALIDSRPQMQVTNRDFSIFLWQNPEFMRQNIRRKSDYLEAWGDRLTVDPAQADQWVDAPSEALFLYFTWQRLLGDYYYPRSIPQAEFMAFLKADPQWDPHYWKAAPAPYGVLLSWIKEGDKYTDLKEVSYKELPIIVRQAFQGWKNFTQESEAISHIRPTYRQLWTFLDKYPNFKRSLWINLVRDTRPNYLLPVEVKGTGRVPEDQLDGLLQIGLYNYLLGTEKNPSS